MAKSHRAESIRDTREEVNLVKKKISKLSVRELEAIKPTYAQID